MRVLAADHFPVHRLSDCRENYNHPDQHGWIKQNGEASSDPTRRTELGPFSLPSSCLYLLPFTIPSPQNNPMPQPQALDMSRSCKPLMIVLGVCRKKLAMSILMLAMRMFLPYDKHRRMGKNCEVCRAFLILVFFK